MTTPTASGAATQSSAATSGSTSSPTSSGTPTPDASGDHIIAKGYVRNEDPIELDVLAFGRVNSSVVALKVRVTNVGDQSTTYNRLWADMNDGTGTSGNQGGPWGALMLVDGRGLKAYHPLTWADHNSEVAQTGFGTGVKNRWDIAPRESFVSTILFPAPPSDVRSVDIESGETDPIQDVPLASSYSLGPGDPQPNRSTNRPYINTLSQESAAVDHSGSVNSTGGKTTVQLHADVLFAFGKATLSGRASTNLQRVAQRIDAADATTIHVDGYTDSVSSAKINDPLSKHRAAAVTTRLKSLVTRDGIRWVVTGHGEHDPIASNDNAAGRAKNRRVTITIG